MKKIITLFLLMSLCACVRWLYMPSNKIVKGFDVPADQILLVVKVNHTEFTGYFPSNGCDSDCVPFSFWYKYDAKVLSVVKGAYDADRVQFANIQHADFIDEVTREWYVQLKTIEGSDLSEKINVQYAVVKHDSAYFHRR